MTKRRLKEMAKRKAPSLGDFMECTVEVEKLYAILRRVHDNWDTTREKQRGEAYKAMSNALKEYEAAK